jgi:TonB-dependent receptor
VGRRINIHKSVIFAGCAVAALSAAPAWAQQSGEFDLNIPNEDLSKALNDLGRASHRNLVFPAELARGLTSPAVQGRFTVEQALDRMLAQSGLAYRTSPMGVIVLHREPKSAQPTAAAPASGEAAAKATDVSEVVVTAAPREEVKARSVQHNAINLVDVQSAETIAKYPDFNAAEALGRIPGVSLSEDTGEGRFVTIRGIDSNLDGATFGGVPLLNTYPGGTYDSGGGRGVEYDTIPTGSIDGIVVTKTPLPDHEAEGLGGTIELTPRTAANITKPFLDATLGWGYEDERDVTGPADGELALGARFGFHNGLVVEGVNSDGATGSGWISNPTPFSFVLTGERMDDRRGFDDLEESYADPTQSRAYNQLLLRHYNYHRRRSGYGGEFDFKPNDNHRFYFQVNVAGYTESVIKNRLDYTNITSTPGANGGFNATATPQLSTEQEQETHRNSVFILGGQDRFGGAVLDYRVSYSRATYYKPYDYNINWNASPTPIYYNNTANNGDFPVLRVNNATINNPALYALNSVSNSQEKDFDQEWAYAANLTLPLHVINDNDVFKFGVEARLRNKEETQASESPTLPALSLADYSGGSPDTNFYGNGYSNGPVANVDKIRSVVDAAGGAYGPYGLVLAAKENIYAGYGEYQTRIGDWRFLAGVRVEATDASYTGDDSVTASGLTSQSVNYTNVFPTVQARYDFTPDFLVRATYSTGISRPGFNQVAAATTYSVGPTITTGNPNLKPTTGNNFDVDFEYYLHNGGIIQVGLFDKEFQNYIVTNFYNAVDNSNDIYKGQLVGYYTYSNVQDAYARGIEADYHQQFTWLPGLFKGFGLDANATVVDSGFQEYSAASSGTGKAQYGLLPGTSRLTWNLAGFYEANKIEARISTEYVGKNLFSLGGAGAGQAGDTIEDTRLQVDWGSSYQMTSNWKLFFNVKNLTNTPLRFYQVNSSLPIQREFYDQTFEFGVKAHF